MKNSSKKTDHSLVLLIAEAFGYIEDLFEEPLKTVQKDKILHGGLSALTQMLLKEPFGECSLSVLYDEKDLNTEVRNLIEEIPAMWELLKAEHGV
ncbi:MAG: hypothetical protein RIB64_23380 [Arenibacter algicola]